MSVQPSKYYFTVEEYYRMAEAGIFTEDVRLELVNGEVLEMTPIGSRHAACVKKLAEMLHDLLGKKVQVGIQDPILLNELSELQPDISILQRKHDFYAGSHPTAKDVYFIIEVADTSLAFDRSIKLSLYAQAGIREVWLIDLQNKVVEIYSNPEGGNYGEDMSFKSGESVSSKTFPELIIPVNEILIL